MIQKRKMHGKTEIAVNDFGAYGLRTGFTLLEMIVAMAVGGIVLMLAFGAWNAVTRHSNRLDQARLVSIETRRIATGLTTDLRRSPSVIAIETHRVRFVSGITLDTLTYEIDDARLLRNGDSVTLRATHARVSDFLVEDISPRSAYDGPARLLRVTLELTNQAADRARVSTLVVVQAADVRSSSVE